MICKMKLKMNKTFFILRWIDAILHWILKTYNTLTEKKRVCPLGLEDCETCPYRSECGLHLLENS